MNTSSDGRRLFWQGSHESPDQPSLDSSLHCDYLVIGAGLVGMSIAIHIKRIKPDAEVVVVDAGVVGHGTSGLSSGICGTRLGPRLEKQVKTMGSELAKEVYHYSCKAMEYAAELITSLKIECEMQVGRQWQVALTKHDSQIIHDRSHLYRSLGFSVPFISSDEIRQSLPSSQLIQSAIEFPCYLLNPYKLCVGLKQELLRAGISLFENTHVTLHKSLGLSGLLANGYPVSSKKIIFAVNAAIGKFKIFPASVLPIQVFAAVTSSLSDEQFSWLGLSGKLTIFDSRPLFNFIRVLPNNRILIGGEYRLQTSESIDQECQATILKRLREQLSLFLPSLRNVTFEYYWHGTVGCTLDDWPIVGPLEGNDFWHVGACNGHGIAASLMVGKEIANSIIYNQFQRDHPWHRSSLVGLVHPCLARHAVPMYLSWLRHRSQLKPT